MRRSVALSLLVAWALTGAGLAQPGGVRAAEYEMRTAATYRVDPAAGEIAVRIQVDFENTTPDPAGRFSLFEVVDLAIHDGAEAVAARDGDGALNVSVGDQGGHSLVSVRPRTGVRYGERISFTLTYRLPDGAGPQVRVRSTLVAFPVWSFGTSGRVNVHVPGDYEVSVAGDELTAQRSSGEWVLASGQIADPAAWLAQLTAVGEATYRTLTAPVALSGGTVDLQVRSWADDEGWGERTRQLLVEALPVLEAVIGLPYPAVGPLVVIESVSGPEEAFGEPSSEGMQLRAAFDQPPFTLLHQASHVWLSDRLAAQRWIREGFASWMAEQAAVELGLDLPFDPDARMEELGETAFPLVSWGAGDASQEQEAYGYAASWHAARRIAAAVGEEALREAWGRVERGMGPYDEVEPPPGADQPAPVDARTLLDQLAAVSEADLDPIFSELVLDPTTAQLLPERAEARAAYAELVRASGGWGAPQPIRSDMTAWRFDRALERMAEAGSWLRDRDRLVDEAEDVGLTVPDRLRDRWLAAGGGAESRTELEAEQAVVAAYREALELVGEERDLLERLGLLGGPDPDTLLSEANALFREGELRGAAERAQEAQARLGGAATDGTVRLLAGIVAVLLLPVLGLSLARRRGRHTDTDYTAAA